MTDVPGENLHLKLWKWGGARQGMECIKTEMTAVKDTGIYTESQRMLAAIYQTALMKQVLEINLRTL